MEIQCYRDLKVWQLGMQIVTAVYRLTAKFPREEIYGMVSQIRRAAISIPSNIAEGHERKSTKEFLRFISIALGSRAELETQLLLSVELEFCKHEEIDELHNQLSELGRMLNGLYRSLKSRVNKP